MSKEVENLDNHACWNCGSKFNSVIPMNSRAQEIKRITVGDGALCYHCKTLNVIGERNMERPSFEQLNKTIKYLLTELFGRIRGDDDDESERREEKRTRTPDSKCCECGTHITGASSSDGSKPSQGDFTLCIKCGSLNVFDADLTLRAPTDDEIIESATMSDLQDLRRKILEVNDKMSESNRKGHSPKLSVSSNDPIDR